MALVFKFISALRRYIKGSEGCLPLNPVVMGLCFTQGHDTDSSYAAVLVGSKEWTRVIYLTCENLVS